MSTLPCTCGCPDGEGQHLENCEVYLRYWEVDQLVRIKLRYQQIVMAMPVPLRDKEIVDDLIAQVVSFVRSTTDGSTSIYDPAQIIRGRLKAAVFDPSLCPFCGERLHKICDSESLYCGNCDHYTDGDCECDRCSGPTVEAWQASERRACGLTQ